MVLSLSLQAIFLTQGLNWRLLHWQVDSLPLGHLGSPVHVWRSPVSPRAAGKDTETTAKTQERRSVFP